MGVRVDGGTQWGWFMLKGVSVKTDCIIMGGKNGGQGKGYSGPDQAFQAEFNGLLFISIALKLNQNFVDRLECLHR